MIVEVIGFFLLLCQLLLVSVIDIQTRKISNYWALCNSVLFLFLLIVYPEYYKASWIFALYVFGVLAVSFILFLFKIMGAGDGKYLFSIFLLIPSILHRLFLEYLLVSTIIIALGLFLYNVLSNSKTIYNCFKIMDFSGMSPVFGKKFPYAPVILVSWIFLGWKRKILF